MIENWYYAKMRLRGVIYEACNNTRHQILDAKPVQMIYLQKFCFVV